MHIFVFDWQEQCIYGILTLCQAIIWFMFYYFIVLLHLLLILFSGGSNIKYCELFSYLHAILIINKEIRFGHENNRLILSIQIYNVFLLGIYMHRKSNENPISMQHWCRTAYRNNSNAHSTWNMSQIKLLWTRRRIIKLAIHICSNSMHTNSFWNLKL